MILKRTTRTIWHIYTSTSLIPWVVHVRRDLVTVLLFHDRGDIKGVSVMKQLIGINLPESPIDQMLFVAKYTCSNFVFPDCINYKIWSKACILSVDLILMKLIIEVEKKNAPCERSRLLFRIEWVDGDRLSNNEELS